MKERLKQKLNELKLKAIIPLVMASATNVSAQNTEQAPASDESANKIELTTNHVKQKMQQDINNRVLAIENFNILYDDKYEAYLFTTTDNDNFLIIEKDDFNQQKKHKEYMQKLKETFKKPTEIISTNLTDLYAAYFCGFNRIEIDKDAIAQYSLVGNRIEVDNEIASDIESGIAYASIISHEKQHRNNDKKGLNENNLSAEYMAKRNMMNEISANLAQASLALKYYQNAGSLEGFKFLAHCGQESITNISNYITNPDNKDKLDTKECYGFIVKNIQDGWLKRNNVAGAKYSDMALPSASDAYKFNFDSQNEYNRQIKLMFSDIKGMGDVSEFINPDFELNDRLKDKINANLYADARFNIFVQNVTDGAKNSKEAFAMLQKAVKPVKKADADGVRTPEEQKEIDNMIQTILSKRRLNQDGDNISAKTNPDVKPNSQINTTVIRQKTNSR